MSNIQSIGLYKTIYRLGKGGSSEVYAAKGPWNRRVAVKYQRAAKKRHRFLQEIDICNNFNHPNLSCVLGFGIDSEGWSYIVMDLIDGQSAYKYASELPETEKLPRILDLAISISKTIQVFHDRNWIHGDIKSKNILVKPDHTVILIDFELTRSLQKTGRGKFFGTRSYAPPEQHKGEVLTPSVDIYSLTTILCKMISQIHPFPKDVEPIDRIECLVLPEDIPVELVHLFNSALQNDPQKRPQNGMEFASKLQEIRDKLPTFSSNKKNDYASLSEIAMALHQSGLSTEECMSVHLLSGGIRSLIDLCIKEKLQGNDWLPTKEKQKWFAELQQYSPTQMQILVLLAILGKPISLITLAQQIGCNKRELFINLKTISHWVRVSQEDCWLRFGAVNFFLVRHLELPAQLQLLQHPQLLKGYACKIAIAMIQRNIDRAELLFRIWVANEACTINQWYFLHRLLTLQVDVIDLRNVLLQRFQGNWKDLVCKTSLDSDAEEKIYLERIQTLIAKNQDLEPKANILVKKFAVFGEIQDAYEMAILGNIRSLLQIKGYIHHSHVDVRATTRILLSEYHLTQGDFYHATKILRYFERHHDPYIIHLDRRQRILIASHLGLKSRVYSSTKDLEKYANTQEHWDFLQSLETHPMLENNLPLRQLATRSSYLQVWKILVDRINHGHDKRNFDEKIAKVIEQLIPPHMSLENRSALLSNPMWRPYMEHLSIPPSPQDNPPRDEL